MTEEITIEQVKRIVSAQGRGIPITEEQAHLLNILGERIQFLNFFYNYIKLCYAEDIHLCFAFSQMDRIIMKRGCLLTPEELSVHFQTLVKLLQSSLDNIFNRKPVLSSITKSISIVATFLFMIPKMRDVTMKLITDMLAGSPPAQIAATEILGELVYRVKVGLPHVKPLDASQHRECMKCVIPSFIQIGIQLITRGALLCGLRLIHNSLQFFDLNTKNINFSPQVKEFFQQPILINFFSIARENPDVDISHQALLILSLIFSSTGNPPQFFPFAAEQMIGLISFPQRSNDQKITNAISLILSKIAPQLSNMHFLNESFSRQFFSVVMAFSRPLFEEGNDSTIHYITSFWSSIAEWGPSIPPPGDYVDLTASAFEMALTTTISSITANSGSWFEKVENMSENDLKPFWRMATISYQRSCHFFAELLTEQVGFLLNAQIDRIVGIVFLLKLGASVVDSGLTIGRMKTNYNLANMEMRDSVVNAAEVTMPIMKNLIDANLNLSMFLENAFIDYFDTLQNKHKTNEPKENDPCTESLLKFFTVFVQRLLASLASYPPGEITTRILMVFKSIANETVANKWLCNTQLMNLLLKRELILNFEGPASKKPRAVLQMLYASLIRDQNQIPEYLALFDPLFESNDQNAIYGLYCDLKGVFLGSVANKNYNAVSQWFFAHAQQILRHLHNNLGNYYIVKAITQCWILLYQEKCDPTKINPPPNGGFAIQLFRTSIPFLSELVQLPNSFEKVYISLKFIDACLSTTHANFGVMKYYGDNSYDQMVGLFFSIVTQNLESNEKLVRNVLHTINSIIKLEIPAERAEFMIEFTFKCLQQRDTKRWEAVCPILETLLSRCTDFTPFRGHFVLVLDAMINEPSFGISTSLSVLFLYMFCYDNAFVQQIIGTIIGLMDQKFRPALEEKFKSLFQGFEPPVTDEDIETFKQSRINSFKQTISMYPVLFSDVPSLSSFFE